MQNHDILHFEFSVLHFALFTVTPAAASDGGSARVCARQLAGA
jgi:hypothetical protein